MLTLRNIRDECVGIDLQELDQCEMSVETYEQEKRKIIKYYLDCKVKKLLEIFSQYNGLSCLSPMERLENGYVIDIFNLVKEL